MGSNYMMLNRTKKNYAYFGKNALHYHDADDAEEDRECYLFVAARLTTYLIQNQKDELMFVKTDLSDIFFGDWYAAAVQRWIGISDIHEFKRQYTLHELSTEQ